MAVAAYASLLSLTPLLDDIHYRAPFHLPLLDINLVHTLQESVQFLLEFVELHHLQTETPEIVDLWRHLAKLAFEAQQMVDSHVVNLLSLRSQGQTRVVDISDFCDDMQTTISKFDIIKKHLLQIPEAGTKPASLVPTVAASSASSSSGKGVVIGFDDHVTRIMDQLTVNKGHLQILSIVGMGGIGKTTLARCVYDDPYIRKYFDRRIWVTISQEFSTKEILLGLLDLRGRKGLHEYSVDKLGERLHKILFSRRYLIIMDDMWSTEVWEELGRYIPDNQNGSRILVTTRDSNVAACLGSHAQYPLSFLDGDTSWELFCQIVFAQRGCPYAELDEIGRAIAKSCRGLPLEISVIGRLLGNSGMTKEYWEDVAKNISSFGNSEDNEHCLKVLSLSYQSLPIHLKPCFLHLRVFREDADISSKTLINHWIAEGFIRPTSDKTVEEIAEQYVDDLVNRSLMFKKERPYETYGVHDLLWDLCVKESDKESFLQSPNFFEATLDARSETGHCLLCGNLTGNDDVINIWEKSLRFPPSSQDDCRVGVACDASCHRRYTHIPKLKLVTAMAFQTGPEIKKVLQFSTELRYLQFWGNDPIVFHQTIHLLWNLETLDIFLSDSAPILLPSEIWEMPRLRHLRVKFGAFLANPTATQIEGNHFIVLKYLHTLSCLRNFKCTKEVIDRIPKLKHLNIRYEIEESMHRGMMQPYYSVCNIEQLHKLESLKVENARENITFPNSLKKLTLSNCQMAWEDMSIIGSLPVLEKLKLGGRGIEGSEWNPVEGEFVQLRELHIKDASLKCWRADSIHFPRLEFLHLWHLPSLEEIPLGIGDIPTLRYIGVFNCNKRAAKSARQIQEDQFELGNDTLQIHAKMSNWDLRNGCEQQQQR